MRTIDANVLAAFETSPRTVGAQLTFRQKRLFFDGHSLTDSLGLSDPSTIDACLYSTGLARVVNYGDNLYVQLVPDIQEDSWPAWVNKSIPLKSGSRPGIEDGYIWYQKADGNVCYRSLDDWETEVVVTGDLASYTVALAPVSGTVAYAQYLDGPYLSLCRISDSNVFFWEGHIYGDLATANYIDAVTLDGRDYIYAMDRNAGRILEMIHVNGMWGGWRYVIPVDDVDDVQGITLSAASVINNQVFLTSRLVRTSDGGPISMDIFSIGPRHFSMGREMFLTSESVGGKMLLVEDVVVYAGANNVFMADATVLVGYDNENLKAVTSAISSFTYSEAENQGASLDATVATDFNELPNGFECDLEISYGGNYAKIATCNIDQINDTKDENGQSFDFNAASSGMKAISDWTPDTSLWFPSQAKMSCSPGMLDKVIRSRGTFEVPVVDGPITTKGINEPLVLYSVNQASRGGLSRAKFYNPTGSTLSRYGVMINYYQESQYDASVRLGIDQSLVTVDQCGDNGILAVWSPVEFNGAPGVGLYLWTSSDLTLINSSGPINTDHLIASASLDIPTDTWHWLQIHFQDGRILVTYRLDSDPTWINVIDTYYSLADRLPWPRETLGRSGVYINNGAINTQQFGMYADDDAIPAMEISEFPTSGTVMIDDEEMQYSGKSNPDISDVFDLAFSSTIFDRTYDTDVFTGYELVVGTADNVNADHYYIGMALIITAGPGIGKTFTITDYDAIGPATWVNTHHFSNPNKWKKHIGDLNYGYWGVPDIRRFFLDTDPSNIVGDGSVFAIVQCLSGVTRGTNGTTVATHDISGIVNLTSYGYGEVLCGWMDCYSLERDNTLEDGIGEVVYRAGSYPVFNRLIENPVIGGAWDSDMVSDAQNPIFDLDIPTLQNGQEVGVVFRSASGATGQRGDGPDIVDGYMITFSNVGGNYWLNLYVSTGSVWSIGETVPLWLTPSGTARISAQDNALSVWLEDRFIHTFFRYDFIDGEYAGFTASFATTLTGYLSELHDFLEDVIIDNRSTGITTIENTINGRIVHYCSDVDGGVRFYRYKYDTGALTTLGYSHNVHSSDKVISRIRDEGLKIVESIDFNRVYQSGNVFVIQQLPYANTVFDFKRAAERSIAEQASMAVVHTIAMIPHPALEVGDVLNITPRDNELHIDITGMSITMSISDQSLTFEQIVQGIEHYDDI